MLQVPFLVCRYLLLNIQVPFSTRQQAIHGTVLFTSDLLTPHTALPSLPVTVPVFWNVSTHLFYSCAHWVVASSTRCHLNRRKLNTYRATRPPFWENGTWQVPSQLSHSASELIWESSFVGKINNVKIIVVPLKTSMLSGVAMFWKKTAWLYFYYTD